MTNAQIIGNGLLLLAGAHGLFFLFAPVAAPRLYLRYTGWGMGAGDDMPWWGMALGFLAMFSIGRVIYCALYSVTFIVPLDWGSPNEDGDWSSYRYQIAFGIACIVTPFVAMANDKAARLIAKHNGH